MKQYMSKIKMIHVPGRLMAVWCHCGDRWGDKTLVIHLPAQCVLTEVILACESGTRTFWPWMRKGEDYLMLADTRKHPGAQKFVVRTDKDGNMRMGLHGCAYVDFVRISHYARLLLRQLFEWPATSYGRMHCRTLYLTITRVLNRKGKQ